MIKLHPIDNTNYDPTSPISPMKSSLLLVLVTFCLSCTKVEILRDVPDCIESKIIDFAENGSICSKGAEVNEYLFQGSTVYTFFQGNCGNDFQSGVYDTVCSDLGGIGGISGNTDINGEDFASNATFIAKVWGN